jgi:ABC-2 type transport system permease protein
LFIIVLSALSNIYIGITYPVPLRADLASYERHIGEDIWETSPRGLIDSFHRNNPQYRSTYNPAVDTFHGSIRFFAAYHDFKEYKVLKKEALLHEEIQKGNDAAEKLSFFSPAVTMQHLLNTIAGTGLQDFILYKNEVAAFQKKWKHTIYTADLSGKNFTASDLKKFPEFKMECHSAGFAGIITGSLILWIMILLFTLLGLHYSKL